MKSFAIVTFTCLLVLINCYTAPGQPKAEVLTNKSIVDLYKAGLGEKLIIAKIVSSSAKFDVSTSGLIALKKEGLSESIIEAMVSKISTVPKSTPAAVPEQSTPPAKVSSSDIPEPETIGAVYFYDATHKLIALEKTNATMHTRTKALGYGGAQATFETEGDKSAVRIGAASAYTFVVNTGGGAGDGFALYKVETRKGKRQAIAATFSTFSGMKGSKGLISVDVKMLKPNILQLIPAAALDKGEYFFVSKSAGNALSATSTAVFAFGID